MAGRAELPTPRYTRLQHLPTPRVTYVPPGREIANRNPCAACFVAEPNPLLLIMPRPLSEDMRWVVVKERLMVDKELPEIVEELDVSRTL